MDWAAVSRRSIRVGFALLVVLAALVMGRAYVAAVGTDSFDDHLDADGPKGDPQVAPPSGATTVVATDSNSWRGATSDGPRGRAELFAIGPDGRIQYYNDSHTRYWDVDPVGESETTVEYVFADHLPAEECPRSYDPAAYGVNRTTWETYAEARSGTDVCTRTGVERVDLATGEVTEIWSHITPGKEASRHHDVERLDEHRLVVADIYLDGVFVVNTTMDEIEWRWNATDAFPVDGTGGPYPTDWTHINDVGALEDGRIVVSVRNHDRVVFLTRDGLQANWTLGEEDDYGILYEQHNPDFIPAERGGPAVLVSDSENNRVVEYQRRNERWEQSWLWRDGRLQWPRDADRLPNDHTLVTDSNGNRVVELDREGEIVWQLDVAFPYEAERLGTGPESAGGRSAASGGLESRGVTVGESLVLGLKGLLPGKYLNGLMYLTPVWMGVVELFALLIAAVVLLAWLAVEARWAIRGRLARKRPDA